MDDPAPGDRPAPLRGGPGRGGAPARGGGAGRGEGCRIEAFPTRHSVPSVGYAVREDERPGRLRRRRGAGARRARGPGLGAPPARRARSTAPDGRTVRPDEVLGAPRPGRTVVVSGDTEPCDATLEAAARAVGAGPRGHLPRRGPRAGARDAAQHGPRGGGAGARGRRRPAGADAPLEPLLAARGPRTRRSASSRACWCRATSTRSRCPSPSAERPRFTRCAEEAGRGCP